MNCPENGALGFDISSKRIKELGQRRDHTSEVDPAEIAETSHLAFTDVAEHLHDRNVLVVTVPTPVDHSIRALGKGSHVLYDVKSLLPRGAADARL